MNMKTILIMSALSLGLFSCSGTKKTMATTEQTVIPNTKWELKKIKTPTGMETVNTSAFIQFDEANNKAFGNGGCNRFSSTFTRTAEEISFKETLSTKMFCTESQKSEDTFFQHLEKVNRLKIDGNTLHLLQDDELLLEFAAASS